MPDTNVKELEKARRSSRPKPCPVLTKKAKVPLRSPKSTTTGPTTAVSHCHAETAAQTTMRRSSKEVEKDALETRRENEESAERGTLNQLHMHRLFDFLSKRVSPILFPTLVSSESLSGVLANWREDGIHGNRVFIYYDSGHFIAARLVDGDSPQLEVLDSLGSDVYANRLCTHLQQVEGIPRLLVVRATHWQVKDADAGLVAAINGCGCYAIHAAFNLQRGVPLSGVQPPDPEGLNFLRSVASMELCDVPGELASRWFDMNTK